MGSAKLPSWQLRAEVPDDVLQTPAGRGRHRLRTSSAGGAGRRGLARSSRRRSGFRAKHGGVGGDAAAGPEPLLLAAGPQSPTPPSPQPPRPSPVRGPDPGRAAAPAEAAAARARVGRRLEAGRPRGRARGGKVQTPGPQPPGGPQPARAERPARALPPALQSAQSPQPLHAPEPLRAPRAKGVTERHPAGAGPRLGPRAADAAARRGEWAATPNGGSLTWTLVWGIGPLASRSEASGIGDSSMLGAFGVERVWGAAVEVLCLGLG